MTRIMDNQNSKPYLIFDFDDFENQIKRWKLSEKEKERLVILLTDFGDMKESLVVVPGLIDTLLENLKAEPDLDPDIAGKTLVDLEIQLDHILWHHKSAKKGFKLLEKIIDEITPQKEE